jgi:hypothetical protein
MTEQKRAFKGVFIPADIWLNENLSLQEKAVLTEIDSFCSHYESCYASNEHFAKFIQVGERRIQKILKSLEDKGFIEREIIYKEGTKEIEKRYLRVREGWRTILHGGGEQKFVTPHEQKFADNNTGMNNTMNNNIYIYGQNAKNVHSKKRKEFVPPTLEEVQAYVTEKGYNIDVSYFYEYYQTTDWHDKKGNKVKNWKLTCLTWHKNSNKFTSNNSYTSKEDYAQKLLEETLADLESENNVG